MIKAIVFRLKICFANRNWNTKRNYLINKGARIGKGTRLNCGVSAFGTEPYLITCGEDCLFADGVQLLTHDGGIKVLNSLHSFGEKRMSKMGAITIGNNVYLGQNVLVLPGVKIGDNVVVGAGSIVTHDLASDIVAVGIPAKPIKTIDEYHKSTLESKDIYCFDKCTAFEKEEILKREYSS